MAVYGGPEIATSGLVLSLDAGNSRSYPGSGTTWTDLVASGDNGTMFNVTYESANNNGVFSFNGSNSYITIPEPNVTFSPNGWTICLWMNPNNKYSRFLTPNSNGIDQWIDWLTSNNVSIVVASSQDTNVRTAVTGTTNSVPVSIWSYVCVSIDNLDVKLYVNGVLNASSTQTLSIGNWDSTWYLGQRGNSTQYYQGKIAMLSSYNRALSAAEISRNFQATRGRFGI